MVRLLIILVFSSVIAHAERIAGKARIIDSAADPDCAGNEH
jgi:hypothetical protein